MHSNGKFMHNNRDPIDESSHWALCYAHYFDTSTQRFQTADIEISEGRIIALLPPGESRTKPRVDGSGMTCVPGLVGELVVDHSDNEFESHAYMQDATLSGITTISIVTDRASDVVADVRRAGVRAEIFSGVGDRSLGRSPSGVICDIERALDMHGALARTFDGDRIRISPAIVSQSFASPRLTVQLHAFAKVNGKRLLVSVDSGRPHSNFFHDAYGCSGTLLLRSLNVLDEHTIAIVDPTLSRHDLNLLADSATGVGIVDYTMLTKVTHASRNLRRVLCAGRGALMCRQHDAAVRPAGGAHGSRAFGWASLPNVDDIADIIVGTMTRAGSAALGLSTIGRIDAGAYADFAIYDSPVSVDAATHTGGLSDSRKLLRLIEARRPRIVVIDGRWRVRDYGLVS